MSEKVEVHFRTNMQMSGADAEANECRARFGSQLYMQLNYMKRSGSNRNGISYGSSQCIVVKAKATAAAAAAALIASERVYGAHLNRIKVV